MSVPGVFDSSKSVGSVISSVVERMAPAAAKASGKAKGMSSFMITVATVCIVGALLVAARIMIARGNETNEDKRKAGRAINNVIDYTFIVLVAGLLAFTLIQQMRFGSKVVREGKSFKQAFDEVSSAEELLSVRYL